MENINMLFKTIDKLEISILKGLPIPLTPYVFVLENKLVNSYSEVKNNLPEELRKDFILDPYKVPHIPFFMINYHTAIKKLDELRAQLSKYKQEKIIIN